MNNLDELVNTLATQIYENQIEKKKWKPGEDWVSYSVDYFTKDEYLAALKAVADGWLVFGKKSHQFEFLKIVKTS